MTLGQSAALSGLAHPFLCTMRELASDLRGALSDLLAGVSGFCRKRATSGLVSPGAAAQAWTREYATSTCPTR